MNAIQNTKTTCLLCDKPVSRRGLCKGHYQKFHRAKFKAIAAGIDVEAFEADAIARGVILPDGREAANEFTIGIDKLKSAPKRKPPKKGDK
jgi:hypothetical protein